MARSPLVSSIIQVVQEYERASQQRLEASERRANALEEENEELREELEKYNSVWGDIADKVLRERLCKFASPPLDTLVREAGVALEDRLRRVVGDEEGKRHGVRLVDAVFRPKTGMLIVSEHSGDQRALTCCTEEQCNLSEILPCIGRSNIAKALPDYTYD